MPKTPKDYTNDVQAPLSAQRDDTDRLDDPSQQASDAVRTIAAKIQDSSNILVALSKDPSVDEIAAALGLALILDRMNKHVTAIYSGVAPNTLHFLKPDQTFERTTDSLQDFIIAINKDKADHLRYKVEGDFVKVYITPYRTKITEENLTFTYGDYNVDLIITIDVDSSNAIDAALSHHGRIMHDAVTVDITTNRPGRFAEIEWSNPDASSVCELVTELADELNFTDYDTDIATALLTGIVAATNRFSNSRTRPTTMNIASRLMAAGADQQLISSHITESTTDQNLNPDVSALIKDDQPEDQPDQPDPSSELDQSNQPDQPTLPDQFIQPNQSDAPVPLDQPSQPVATGNQPDPTALHIERPEVVQEDTTSPAPTDYSKLVQEAMQTSAQQPDPSLPAFTPDQNPAETLAPTISATPDTSVPEIQYFSPTPISVPEPTPPAYPTPDMFPPAPAPNVDPTALPPANPTATPLAPASAPSLEQPAVPAAHTIDPGSFHIPGA